LPFRKTADDFFTSALAVSTNTYGYTYPEIAAGGDISPDKFPAYIQQVIDELYGPGNFVTVFTAGDNSAATHRAVAALGPKIPLNVEGNVFRIPKTEASPSNVPNSGYVITPDTYRDWIVNITVEKWALGGSGIVGVFLGKDIPDNPVEWVRSDDFVGTFDIWTSKVNSIKCSKCKKQAEERSRVGGTIHLTKDLIRRQIALVDQAPIDYLAQNLSWSCLNADGVVIPPDDIPSLKVAVLAAGYEIVPGLDPQRQPFQIHYEVTRGKAGGVSDEADL
jgi:hypothetical protein